MIRSLLAIGALATLAACGQADQAYPPQYEYGFMQACEVRQSRSLCTCAWQRVVAEIPRREFEAFEQVPAAEREAHPLRARLAEFYTSCAAAEPTPLPAAPESAQDGAPVEPTP